MLKILKYLIFLIVFNTNKAKMSHAAMGDAGYAHSVVMGALSSGKTTDVVVHFLYYNTSCDRERRKLPVTGCAIFS